MDEIDAKALLQRAGKEGKSARQNGCLVTEQPESSYQSFGAVGEWDRIEQSVDAFSRQALEEGDPASEALIKSDLSAHGGLGDADDTVADAGHLRQLVDDFSLD